jgi:phosphatidylglycerol:prolipoprotein diacylglycerol transferase
MFPVLNLGPLSLPVPEFALLIGFWLGSYLSVKFSSRRLVKPDLVERILWTSLLAGVLGARLSYFARQPDAFSGNYLSLLSINFHLFDLQGGLLIALLAGLGIVSKNKVKYQDILDSLSPFFATMAAAIHFSKYASGTGYGLPATLPWSVYLWGDYRHPVQLYFLAGSLLVILITIFINLSSSYAQGLSFRCFVILTNFYLLLFTKYQYPGYLLGGEFRLAQLVYWFGLLLGLTLIVVKPLKSEEEKSSHAIAK